MTLPTELTGAKPSFTALPNWLRGQASPLELALMWTMQSHYPEIRPSIALMARESCMSERTVRRVVEDLIRKGWLARIPRRDGTGRSMANLYELRVWADNPPRVEPEAEQDRKHRDAAARRSRVSPKRGEGVTESPRPVSVTPYPVTESPPASGSSLAAEPIWGEGVRAPRVSQRQGGGCQSDRGEGVRVTPEVNQEEEDQEEERNPTALRAHVRATDPQPSPVKAVSKPRAQAFTPTADDIPADLLSCQTDLLDFWAEKRGQRTARAWACLLRELQRIHRDPAGGAAVVSAQLGAAIQAGWQSVTFDNWQRYGSPSQASLPFANGSNRRYASRAERQQQAIADVTAFLAVADPEFAPPEYRTTIQPLRHA